MNKKNPQLIILLVLIAAAIFLFGRSLNLFDISGPSFPATASTDVGAVGVVGWVTLSNIFADDAIYTTAGPIGASTGSTYWIIGQNFGFNIPVGSTINGIVITLEGKHTAPSGVIYDYYRLRKNSAWASSERAGIPLSTEAGDSIIITGSSTDLWSTTWTPADINSPSFGIAYRTTSNTINYNTRVDYIKITVYYTPLATTSSTSTTTSSTTSTALTSTTSTTSSTTTSIAPIVDGTTSIATTSVGETSTTTSNIQSSKITTFLPNTTVDKTLITTIIIIIIAIIIFMIYRKKSK